MNRKRKRAAVLLAALLVLCALPLNAFARERDGGGGEYLGDDIYAHPYQGWFGSGLDSLLIACFRTAIPEGATVTTPGGEVIARREITYVDGMHLMNAVSVNDTGPRTHANMRLTHLWRDAEGNPVYCYDYATDDDGGRTLYSFDDLPSSYVNRERFVRAWQMASALSADGFALLRANLRSACRDVSSVVDPSWVMSGEVTYERLVNDTNALQAIVQECVWLVMHDASAGEIQIGTSFGGGSQVIHTKDGDVVVTTALQSETAENGAFIDFARLIGIGTGAGAPYGTPDLVSSGTTPGDIANPGASGGQLLVVVRAQEYTGYVRVVKSSTNANVSGGDPDRYALSGAVYGVYADPGCTQLLGRLTTGEDGSTGALEIDLGTAGSMTVYVKEIEAPANYRLDTEVYPVTVSGTAHASEAEAAVVRTQDAPVTGFLRAGKTSSDPDISAGNRMYPLSEITFRVYTDQGCTEQARNTAGQPVVLTTDVRGATGVEELPLGTYWVREDSVPGGWIRNTVPSRVTVSADHTAEAPAQVTLQNEPGTCPLGIILTKVDAETGESVPQGVSSLAGAQFTVEYYDDTAASGDPLRTWVFATDEDGRILLRDDYLVSGDDLFTDAGGRPCIPVGTVTVRETLAPEGYVLNEEVRTIRFAMQEDGTVVPDVDTCTVSGGVTDLNLRIEDRVMRADLSFLKLDIDGRAMANIPFLISRLDGEGRAVESHVIVSDENGVVDTRTRPKTGDEVNCLDGCVSNGVFTDEFLLTGNTGIWFGEESARAEGMGSLIRANYRITELRCAANEGQDLLEQELFPAEDGSFEDGGVCSPGAVFIDLIIRPETDLTDDAGGTRTVTRGDEVAVTDTFRYDHLKVSKNYILETDIVYVDSSGTRSVLGANRLVFSPLPDGAAQTVSGTVANTVLIDTSRLDGGMLHAVDRLYAVSGEGEVLLLEHNAGLEDERQSLLVSRIEEPETPADRETAAEETPAGHMDERRETQAPAVPESSRVQTGDDTPAALLASVCTAAGAAVIAVAVLRKKRKSSV